MRILLMTTGLRVGGAEHQVVALADEFARQGHDVMTIVLTGALEIRPQHPQIAIERLNIKKNVFSLMAAYLRAARLVRRFRPDVVHSHMVHANIFARTLRLVCPMKKLICSAHSTHEGGKLRIRAYRVTDALADVTTNVSQAAVRAFEEQGAARPGRMIVVGNGVNTRIFCRDDAIRDAVRNREGIAPNQKVILAVGRLTAAKNYPGLLDACARTLQLRPDTRLWIVGEGELEATLAQLVADLGMADRVRLLGRRDDVAQWMNAADVFVLASAWEGFGLVVAEAMACEKVVVSTRVGGVGEVLGDCGILVEPGDSTALAAALNHALGLSRAQVTDIGRQARARVLAGFSLEQVAHRWLRLYESPAGGLPHRN